MIFLIKRFDVCFGRILFIQGMQVWTLDLKLNSSLFWETSSIKGANLNNVIICITQLNFKTLHMVLAISTKGGNKSVFLVRAGAGGIVYEFEFRRDHSEFCQRLSTPLDMLIIMFSFPWLIVLLFNRFALISFNTNAQNIIKANPLIKLHEFALFL